MPSKQVQFSSDTHVIATHSNDEYGNERQLLVFKKLTDKHFKITNYSSIMIDRSAIQVEKMSYMDMYELLIFKSQMQQAMNSQRTDETNSVTSSLTNDLQTSSTVAVELCT